MSSEYHKVSTTWRDSFIYLSGGSAVTGLTQSSFTIEVSKNGTGNQSTTGITIAEVDDTNNAGEYSIDVNGTTGFVSAVGTYVLDIYRTSTPTDRWTQVIRVTGTGTGGSSTSAAAEFTATASDGRITDGTNPLSGATVYLRNSSGVVVTEATTNASGLWGPVYLEESVTIYAQKAGYQQATGSITVSGTVATGPGADIACSPTSASSGLTASSLVAYARRQARDRLGSKADTELYQIVNDAQTMAAKSGEWQHLMKVAEISLDGVYETGTIAVSNGSTTVTLTAGTWPSWAASGEIVIGARTYRIASRDSDTQLTLSTAWDLTAVSGGTYQLIRYRYSLPDDFLQFGEIFQGQSWPYQSHPMPYKEILRFIHTYRINDTRLRGFSIASSNLVVYPPPSDDVTIYYSYKSKPTDLSDPSDTSVWDANHIDILYRAIDYQVSLRYGTTAADMSFKQCEEAFGRAVGMGVTNDSQPQELPSPTSGGRGRFTNRYTQVNSGA